jgi:hypothetical protein
MSFAPRRIEVTCFLALSLAVPNVAVAAEPVKVTVCQLIKKPERFAGQMVSVRGYILLEYHGMAICSEECVGCIRVVEPQDVSPKPEFDLERDSAYEEFDRLSVDVGLVKRLLGEATLRVTLVGRFDSIYEMRNGKRVRVAEGLGLRRVPRRLVLQKVTDVVVCKKPGVPKQ